MEQVILTIDAGTTSVKTSVFSKELIMLATSIQEYQLCTVGGFVEVPAQKYITAVCLGIEAVKKAVPNIKISAIGITTQGESFVALDKNGEPLDNFIVWLDSRAENEANQLLKQFSEQRFYEETGLPAITSALPLAKLLWLKNNKNEIFSKANKFLLLEDFLLYKLTGLYVSEKSIQTSTGWFSLTIDDYWPEALSAVGLSPQKLPILLESGSFVGSLTNEAASLFSLDKGIPIVAGAMDQTAAALAAGSTKAGVVTETTGTALVLTACTDNPVFAKGHHVTIYRHAIKGQYLYLPIGNTAGMALKWFRDTLCSDISQGGYDAMDSLAVQSCCGANGIVFLPYLSGAVDPDNCPSAVASFFGITLATTREDLTRSVLEATGYMLRDFMDMLKELGIVTDTVLSLGGGSRSSVWMQIKADICKKTLYSAQCSEAASEGAALLALWGAGILARGERPMKNGIETAYIPNLQNGEIYDKAYSLYKNLYSAVKPLF